MRSLTIIHATNKLCTMYLKCKDDERAKFFLQELRTMNSFYNSAINYYPGIE